MEDKNKIAAKKKSKINSRAKGARGERELASAISTTFGIDARRGRQFSGSPDSPDVATGFKNVHIECKRVENLCLSKAYRQAVRDAGSKIPVVIHRKNNEPWMISYKLEDALALAKEILENSNVQATDWQRRVC